MKLAPPWFNGDHGAKVCLVTQQLGNQLVWNRLSLRFKTADEMWGCDVEAGGSYEENEVKKNQERKKKQDEGKEKDKIPKRIKFLIDLEEKNQ